MDKKILQMLETAREIYHKGAYAAGAEGDFEGALEYIEGRTVELVDEATVAFARGFRQTQEAKNDGNPTVA